jgi:hypothetical protein
MKTSTRASIDPTTSTPDLPPPAKNSDIRPWIQLGEIAEVAVSGIEHQMHQAHATLGSEMLAQRDNLRAARDLIDQALNVIDLWASRTGPASR